MKQPRCCVPLLGILALLILFFKMPEAPDILGIFKCKTCGSNPPYLPLLGASYFSILMAVALLFPSFPHPWIARGGVVWAILLALALTYIDFPRWCIPCLLCHACNILIWILWMIPAEEANAKSSSIQERLFLVLFAPITVVALFSSLNLTFLVYHLKSKQNVLSTSLQPGDAVPIFPDLNHGTHSFSHRDISAAQAVFINFVSPNCPYCTEQLSIIGSVATQWDPHSYRFINISPSLPSELIVQAINTEWFVDHDGKLRELFQVSGYPTLFVATSDGKIAQIISGVPSDLKNSLFPR
jgi:thiol-disulfide isomerase/thioredoxin